MWSIPALAITEVERGELERRVRAKNHTLPARGPTRPDRPAGSGGCPEPADRRRSGHVRRIRRALEAPLCRKTPRASAEPSAERCLRLRPQGPGPTASTKLERRFLPSSTRCAPQRVTPRPGPVAGCPWLCRIGRWECLISAGSHAFRCPGARMKSLVRRGGRSLDDIGAIAGWTDGKSSKKTPGWPPMPCSPFLQPSTKRSRGEGAEPCRTLDHDQASARL